MKSLRVSTFVAVVCLTVAGSLTVAGDGDGFQWSDLNPFHRSTPQVRTPSQPSRLSTWSRNTRRSVSNATRWMNPWAKPATPPPRPSLTGSQRVTSRPRPSSEPESEGNWFTRMFTKEEEAPRTATLPDFVGGERPGY